MTKTLEEFLDLPPMEDSFDDKDDAPIVSREELLEESKEIINALGTSEKIDIALASVTGLLEHDDEMDEITEKALASYQDAINLSRNISDAHVGKVLEVAATMLKTAMEARDAKVAKKLKMIDLQLKKLKLDKDNGSGSGSDDSANEFDRDELLDHIKSAMKPADSDK